MISVENTVPVATEYLFYPRFYQDTGDRHPCSTCTDHHAAEITHFFPDDFNCVDCSGKRHNGCSMLVIMKYWNLELFPKSVFNLETAGCRDIFQVDAAKTRGHPDRKSTRLNSSHV